MITAAQRRADAEVTNLFSNDLAGPLRCGAAKASQHLLRIFSSGADNSECVGALRIVQALCKADDGSFGMEFAGSRDAFSFLSFYGAFDSVSCLIALDVFASLAIYCPAMVGGLQDGFVAVCRDLSTADPFRLSKALSVVNTCCAIAGSSEVVVAHVLPALEELLVIESHIDNELIDSQFVVQEVLGVVRQIAVSAEVSVP